MSPQIQLEAVDWLIIAAALIGVYILLLLSVQRSDWWRSRGVTVWGPVPVALFLRTTRGLDLLDRLSRPKMLWRILASAGVPLVVLSMAYFLILLVLMAYIMIQEPPEPGSYSEPRNILLIPGLNEYIPFVWGWIALFVTMVVHEFAHGILSRVEGVRVRSMGIVTFLMAPIAAFVEPDEEELFGSRDRPAAVSKGARIRILSAGVISNFLVAALAMALLFGPVLGSITPLERLIVVDVQDSSPGSLAGFESGMVLQDVDGKRVQDLGELYSSLGGGSARIGVVNEGRTEALRLSGEPSRGIMVASVFQGSPAASVGLPARSVISRIDGREIADLEEFRGVMNASRPGQTIEITTGDGGTYQVRLTSKEDGLGFIGIGISGDAVYAGGVTFQKAPAGQFLQVLRAIPGSGMQGLTYLLSLPFAGIPGFTQKGFPGFSGWLTAVYEPSGWAEPLGVRFFWIA
ncbi:MAG: PDZ domain-containing protein, partial [Methanothrix sp.]|nr:PDZ domain-containing protein [Methanothrix sp.]